MMRAPMRTLALMGAGFVVWACGLVAVYSAVSLGCGRAPGSAIATALLHPFLVALALATVVVAAWVAWRLATAAKREGQAQRTTGFVLDVAFHAALAATVSAGFTFSGLAFLSPCG